MHAARNLKTTCCIDSHSRRKIQCEHFRACGCQIEETAIWVHVPSVIKIKHAPPTSWRFERLLVMMITLWLHSSSRYGLSLNAVAYILCLQEVLLPLSQEDDCWKILCLATRLRTMPRRFSVTRSGGMFSYSWAKILHSIFLLFHFWTEENAGQFTKPTGWHH